MNVLAKHIKQDHFEGSGQEAMLSLFVATALLRKDFQALCHAHGLTLSQFNILRILRGMAPQGYPRCEISARMVEPAPDMTRLINRLEKAGFVERKKSSIDKRQSLAFITDKGLLILEELNPLVAAFNQALSETLGEKDTRALIDICRRIITKK